MKEIENWTFDKNKNCLFRVVEFKSYLKNISFVNAVAYLSNLQNHHPELHITFNQCRIELTTHDANGVTEKDYKLALEINKLLL